MRQDKRHLLPKGRCLLFPDILPFLSSFPLVPKASKQDFSESMHYCVVFCLIFEQLRVGFRVFHVGFLRDSVKVLRKDTANEHVPVAALGRRPQLLVGLEPVVECVDDNSVGICEPTLIGCVDFLDDLFQRGLLVSVAAPTSSSSSIVWAVLWLKRNTALKGSLQLVVLEPDLVFKVDHCSLVSWKKRLKAAKEAVFSMQILVEHSGDLCDIGIPFCETTNFSSKFVSRVWLHPVVDIDNGFQSRDYPSLRS